MLSYPSHQCMLSHFSQVWLSATLCTIICQVPPSIRFSRQEYWSGLPCPSPGDFPDLGIKPASVTSSPALAGRFFTTSSPIWEAPSVCHWWGKKLSLPRSIIFQKLNWMCVCVCVCDFEKKKRLIAFKVCSKWI